jgi:serine/threonine protein kinase
LIFNNGYFETNFTEVDKLGSGSFGEVWKAKHNLSSNIYAVKKMLFEKDLQSEISRELWNLKIAQSFSKEFIINHHYSWFEYSPVKKKIILYISMDLCDKTLEDIIDEIHSDSYLKVDEILTPIGYYIASKLFIEILECVQYLHEHNIIHRDLNLTNIMLKWDKEKRRFIRIVDFGLIAFHQYAEQLHSPEKGQIKFTAPENLDGEKYNTKTDIYSLGVIFRHLFDIDFDEYKKIIRFILILILHNISFLEIHILVIHF